LVVAVLLPSTEKAVSFQASGTVAQVKVGDRVRAGEALATLNTLDLEVAVREATCTLEQARLTLQKSATIRRPRPRSLTRSWRCGASDECRVTSVEWRIMQGERQRAENNTWREA
jgi:multidrug efflux pump subunit AcrA (membrane-fusion protein)